MPDTFKSLAVEGKGGDGLYIFMLVPHCLSTNCFLDLRKGE